MMNLSHPQILSPDASSFWRQAYLQAFVNTHSDYYPRYISTLREYPDGKNYDGYLWDCLHKPSRIAYQRLRIEVAKFPEIFVMADHHSRNKIVGAPLWPYPPYSVTLFKPQILLNMLSGLPKDVYILDSSVSWTLVLTHEHDNKRRLCCAVGIVN